MKLELSQSLQQQQILAPQMILSMDILLLPSLDLEQRIREEFAENPALEMVDRLAAEAAPARTSGDEPFSRLEALRDAQIPSVAEPPRKRSSITDSDSKYEALQNTADRPPGLKETLLQQVRMRGVREDLASAASDVINNLDQRGYLLCPASELLELAETSEEQNLLLEALTLVRSLDPAGVCAEDIRDCLILQLERDRQEYPLECEIILDHLEDLGRNKIPKIARDLNRTIDEIKDAVEIIASLDPIPGGRVENESTIYIRPDVVVEIADGELEVRVENGNLPPLRVNDACRDLLKQSSGNREINEFLRKKLDSAQWLIQAIEQRQRTLRDISLAVVDFQSEFMLEGPTKIRALKMQTIADIVGVHISTISRAIKGKHIQTPHGLFEMRYFFTGGVEGSDGELESRRNIYLLIEDLIKNEDKKRPLSDNAIAKLLQEKGLQIARRTVTKYREQKSIPSSRLRKEY